jgi:hypothetical protein
MARINHQDLITTLSTFPGKAQASEEAVERSEVTSLILVLSIRRDLIGRINWETDYD